MPPKKNAKSSQDVVLVSADDDDKLNMASSSSLEDFLDRRLEQQLEHINDLFMKYSTMTKKYLDAVKSSQSFLSSKFDDLIKSVEEVKGRKQSASSGKRSTTRTRWRRCLTRRPSYNRGD
jgi:hypothetical protein